MSSQASGHSSGRYSGRVDYSYLEAPEFLGKTAVSGDDSLQIPTATTSSPVRKPTSRRQLAALEDRLSERDHKILELLRRFRLGTTDQIQRQIFVDHHSQDSARRTARRCIRRLADHGLVEALGQRIGGVRAGSSSMVWILTPLGHRLLGTPVRKYRHEPSITHIRHLLAIGQLATELIEHGRHQELEIDIVTEPDCWRSFGNRQPQLKPDMHSTVSDTDTDLVWFVEIDRGTESGNVLARKLKIYTRYWRAGIEQDEHSVFPLTVWIAPDERRADFIRNVITKTSGVEPQLFIVTNAQDAIGLLTNFDPPETTTCATRSDEAAS